MVEVTANSSGPLTTLHVTVPDEPSTTVTDT